MAGLLLGFAVLHLCHLATCPSEAITVPPAHKHVVGYITSHKGPAVVATFSQDGELGNGRGGGGGREGGRRMPDFQCWDALLCQYNLFPALRLSGSHWIC